MKLLFKVKRQNYEEEEGQLLKIQRSLKFKIESNQDAYNPYNTLPIKQIVTITPMGSTETLKHLDPKTIF